MDDGVVSLVPSLTELAWQIGAAGRLIGRTRFCTEPAGEVEAVAIIGGTKNPHVERIIGLRPALVLANKEENRREDIEELEGAGLRVLLTDPNTVSEAVAMVREIGGLLGEDERAEALAHEIEAELAAPPAEMVRVFVPIWKAPLMGLGSNAYGHDLLERAGAVNVLGGRERYPEVTLGEVAALEPEIVLMPDEPWAFTEADAAMFAGIAPARVVDGKLLWWYGPRIPEALRSLRALLASVRA